MFKELIFLSVFDGKIAGLHYECEWQTTGYQIFAEHYNNLAEGIYLDRHPVDCPYQTALRQFHVEEMTEPASAPYIGLSWFVKYNYECCKLPLEAVENVKI